MQTTRFYGSAKTHPSVAQKLAALVPQKKKKTAKAAQKENVVKPRKNAKAKNNTLEMICGVANDVIVPSPADHSVQPMNLEIPVLEDVTNTLHQEASFLDHVATPGQEDMTHSPRRRLHFTDVNTKVQDCQCTCPVLLKELLSKVTNMESEVGGQVNQLQTAVAGLKEGIKEQMVEAMKKVIEQTREEWQVGVCRTIIATHHQAVQVSGLDDRGLEDRRGGLEDRRGGLEDRRGGLEDRSGGLEDRSGLDEVSGMDDHRGGLEDRRGGLEDRRGGLEDRRRDQEDRRRDLEDRRGGLEDRRGGLEDSR
ncbi:uncharacterized protein LOC135046684 [Pseudophryne corroboree]|uniref:uncharacterized protein LOC135046684 n=1 Tax=Pseudophryne corroboree TaxID=495146 RepID=UPI003082067C